ncbi:MAG: chromophore lyase CpcT/CpeT [Melioribacteraceae bacterium]|nr:chromophore lyase CpcT/CpeT [Melioribacteraceae bacterium]
MKLIRLCFTFFIMLSSVVFANSGEDKNDELNKLKSWMTGSFSSEEQAELDTNFYNIHLEMIQIWNEREDAIWLYVEQAASWSLDKPYRQRVYRLNANEDGSFESAVFTFDDPLRFAGAFKLETPLAELSPDSLIERDGCAIILNSKGDFFEGSTIEKNCSSELRGAVYATSEVRIEETVLTSWDRGFDENDEQVWGAITGPYIFKKK